MAKDDDLLTSAAKAIGSAIGKVSSTLHIADQPAPVKPAAKKRSQPKKTVAKKSAAKKTVTKKTATKRRK